MRFTLILFLAIVLLLRIQATPGIRAEGPMALATPGIFSGPDLRLQMTVSETVAVRDQHVIYTVVVANDGVGAANDVRLQANMGNGLAHNAGAEFEVVPSPFPNNCSLTVQTTELSCRLGTMGSGASYTITLGFDVIAPGPALIRSTGNLTSPTTDWDTANNASQVELTVAQTGTVVINLHVDPAPDPTDFTYTDNIPDCDIGPLDNDGSSATPDSTTCNNLLPGAYTVSQNPVAGYSLTGLTCSDSDNGTTTNGPTASIDLDGGETVTCDFRNQRILPTPTATTAATATATATPTPTGTPIAPAAPAAASTQAPAPAESTSTPVPEATTASRTPTPEGTAIRRTPSPTPTRVATLTAGEEAEEGGGGLLLFVVGGAVLVAGLGGGAWYRFSRKP